MNTSVDEMIERLPKDEKAIVKRLRYLVVDTLPAFEEKLSYGIPIYSHHRIICFIWPPTHYWGKNKEAYMAKGVTLGFWQGHRMDDVEGVLIKEKRKQVYCLYFKTLDQIDDQQVRTLLYDAYAVDETFAKSKAKGRRK